MKAHENESDHTENDTQPIVAPSSVPMETKNTITNKKSFPIGGIIGIAAAVAIVIGISGFVAGMQYQKGIVTTSSTNVTGQRGDFGGIGGRGGMSQNGAFGEVTAISDSSITVATRQRFNSTNSSNTSTTKTYTINSSTTITVDGANGKISDIQTGDRVVIEPSTNDSSVAASIRAGQGSMIPPMGTQQSTDGSTDTTTRTD